MSDTNSRIDFAFDGVGHVLADNNLQVPKYQRAYAWGDRHVSDLFNDIERAITSDEAEYFLGTVVVAANELGVPEVVDGQQRLATVTILLAAIRDFFDGIKQASRADDINQPFLVLRDRRTQEVNPKLTLNSMDHDFFLKRVIDRDSAVRKSATPTRDSHKRIAKAADLAAAHVQKLAQTQKDPTALLLDRVDYIEKKSKIMYVVVPSFANAFVIFETLNDRGLDLAISDLLKNYLFLTSGKRLTEVQEKWVGMYDLFVAADNEGNVADYIRQLWSSRNGLTRERELYNKIKINVKGPQGAVNFANELSRGARFYQAIVNPSHPLWAQYGTTASQYIMTLNHLNITRVRPLILAVLDNFSEEEVTKSLKLMVSWAVRFMIVGGLGTGTLEEYYSDRAKEIHKKEITGAASLRDAMSKQVPTDVQFEQAFITATVSKRSLARYYLRILERAEGKEVQPEMVANDNPEEVNLEHVLPEEPADKWPNISREIYLAYHHRIGNLALMKERANSDEGNEGPLDKQKAYATSKLALTRQIAETIAKAKAWGPEQIDARQKELAKLAVVAWTLKFDR